MNLMQMSMSAGVLILGIVLFRFLFIHRLPKNVMVILWQIAILRLLVPFSIALPLPEPLADIRSLIENAQAYGVKMEKVDENWTEGEVSVVEETALTGWSGQDWRNIAIDIYLTGAAVMLFGSLFLYARDSQLFKEGLLMSEHERKRLLSLTRVEEKDAKNLLKVKFKISDRTATPVTYGVIRPAVVFPKGKYFKEEKEAGFCLKHELIHIKNHDNLKKMIAHLALCIHWFNPLVWVMYLLFNRDIELLCDETVVRRSGENRQEYALTLLALAQSRSVGFQTVPGFGKNAVKERIVAIMTFKKVTLPGALAAVIAVAGALTVFVTNSAVYTESNVAVTYDSSVEDMPSDLNTCEYAVGVTAVEDGPEAYMDVETADTAIESEVYVSTNYR